MSGDWLLAEAKLEALRFFRPHAAPDYYGYEVSSSNE